MCWVLASRHLGGSWRFALMPSAQRGRKSRFRAEKRKGQRGLWEEDMLPGPEVGMGGPGLFMWLYSSWNRTASSVVGFQAKHWGQNLSHSSARR